MGRPALIRVTRCIATGSPMIHFDLANGWQAGLRLRPLDADGTATVELIAHGKGHPSHLTTDVTDPDEVVRWLAGVQRRAWTR